MNAPMSIQSCGNCGLVSMCLPLALTQPEMTQLDGIIKKSAPYRRGESIFRQGDAFTSIYAVRAGMVKTTVVNTLGEEQITGFYFPGELLGLNGLHENVYSGTAIALETVSLCEIPFLKLDELSALLPELRRQLMRQMSQEISDEQNMMLVLAKTSAEEKLGNFLIRLSLRFKRLGFSATQFRLTMSRVDIGNYLGLAVETVSRTLTKLQQRGVIKVAGKEITILDMDGLSGLNRKADEPAKLVVVG
ncbi:MAG TPA: transcriptional regulator FNR [Oceanospirillaceae bacterium]|nr:transcriptional regulator FNR [Oceanospirillaceae bacterium]